MAIRYIDSNWKTNLKEEPDGPTDRVYLDFRRLEFAPLDGSDYSFELNGSIFGASGTVLGDPASGNFVLGDPGIGNNILGDIL